MVNGESNSAVMLGTCLAVVTILPFEAWLLMLVLGAVHGAFAAVPAVGFGTAVLFVIGVNMLIGYARKLFRRQ
ncbi:hypothetical protein ACFW08_05795 [Streptomyces sp. NPDC058960]|uniref:hypothetical protein n=1 Tax=Streptomyces sp. NPDC058960 TaxID=3346679 RepID=UPI003674736A